MKRYVNQILASAFIATGALGILLSPWTVFTLWHDDYRWIGSNGVAGRLDDADLAWRMSGLIVLCLGTLFAGIRLAATSNARR